MTNNPSRLINRKAFRAKYLFALREWGETRQRIPRDLVHEAEQTLEKAIHIMAAAAHHERASKTKPTVNPVNPVNPVPPKNPFPDHPTLL